MNKMLKKVFSFLCLGVVFFAVDSVKAASDNLSFVVPLQLETDSNGYFSMEVSVSRCDELLMGDVDENGIIEQTDVQLILKYIEGTSGIAYTNKFKALADVDKDGLVTDNDAKLVQEVALKINEEGFGTTNWYTYYSESEIESLNYTVVNGYSDPEMASEVDYLVNEKSFTYTPLYIEYNSPIDNRTKSIHLGSSNDKTSIGGYLGPNRVDNLYIIIVAKLSDGIHADIIKYDVSADSYWKFLNNTGNNSNDENQVTAPGKDEENKNDEVTKDEDKKEEVKVESESETKTETKTETTKDESKTEEKEETNSEETVENPDTGVTIPLVGSIVTIIVSIIAKKKNLFMNI